VSYSPTMRLLCCSVLLGLFARAALAQPEIAKPTTLALPGGRGGIGFDDLRFSPELHRVLAPDGKQLGAVTTGMGVDIIAYAPALAHLYVPGGDSATLTILAVDSTGKPAVLGTVVVAADAHCVTADDGVHAYVCDPKHGALLVVTAPFPATK
jgi:hypothetical protein